MDIKIEETVLKEAAGNGSDAFLTLIHDKVLEVVGGEVNAQTLTLTIIESKNTIILEIFMESSYVLPFILTLAF